MFDEIITHNNGERSYKVDYEKADTDKYFRVKVFRYHRDTHEYTLFKEWDNVSAVWTGKLNVSVLLELDDENDNHRSIVHIYNDRITSYKMTAQESISKYVNDVTDSDVVLAYFSTECGRIYVFDDHTLLILKKPPMDEIQRLTFWTWYYSNFSVKTFESRVLDIADTHSM